MCCFFFVLSFEYMYKLFIIHHYRSSAVIVRLHDAATLVFTHKCMCNAHCAYGSTIRKSKPNFHFNWLMPLIYCSQCDSYLNFAFFAWFHCTEIENTKKTQFQWFQHVNKWWSHAISFSYRNFHSLLLRLIKIKVNDNTVWMWCNFGPIFSVKTVFLMQWR